MSSPEAQSGSSSSEDEFDLGAASMKVTEEPKSEQQTDHSKLFSDDEDEEDDAKPPKQEKGSDDDGDGESKEKEMEDLFGSDYDSEEEEFKASGIKESPVRGDDARNGANDMFSEDAAEYGSHSNEIWIPRTPKAPKSASYFITKMPNILRLVPEAYTKKSIEEEMQNPSDETLYRNYVRWRYQRDANGRVKIDPVTKRPMRESNTKLVQWEDGTLTMFVGKEALNLSRQKIANSFLFVNEMSSDKPEFDDDQDAPGQETVLECHARLHEKFTIRPMTTSSKSHKSLTMSMRAKHNKGVQKIKEYISELDGYREQEQRVKIMDDQLRLQNRKKARQGYEFDRERSSRMDASFLEEGYDGVEYDDDDNVGAIKEQFGGRGSGNRKPGKKPAQQRRPPMPSSYRGAEGFDEYRRNRAREAEKSESENDDAEEDQDEEDDEEMVIRSTKKRRTVDEDSD
ncbi:Leo1p like protein, partial [Globisporangium splendens]